MRWGGSALGGGATLAVADAIGTWREAGAGSEASLLVSFEVVSVEDGQSQSQPAAPLATVAASISAPIDFKGMIMESAFLRFGRAGLALRFAWIEVDCLHLPLVEIGGVLWGNVERVAFLNRAHCALGMRAPGSVGRRIDEDRSSRQRAVGVEHHLDLRNVDVTLGHSRRRRPA